MYPRALSVAMRRPVAVRAVIIGLLALSTLVSADKSGPGDSCNNDNDCEGGALCKDTRCCVTNMPNEEYCTRCVFDSGECGGCEPGYTLFTQSGTSKYCKLGSPSGSTCSSKITCRSYNCRKIRGPDKCGSGRYTGVQCDASDTGTDACISGFCRGHCCAVNSTRCLDCSLGSGNCVRCEEGYLPYHPSTSAPCVWWPATQMVILGSILVSTPLVAIAWRRRRRATNALLEEFAHLGIKRPSAWVTFKGFAPVTLQVTLLATDVVTDLLALAEFHINGELGYFWADAAMLGVTMAVFCYMANAMWGDVYSAFLKKTKAIPEEFCLRVLVQLLLFCLAVGLSPILLMLSPVVSIAEPGLAGVEEQDDPRIVAAIEEMREKQRAERVAAAARQAAERRGEQVGEVVVDNVLTSDGKPTKERKKGAWRKSIPMSAANKLMLVEAFVESLPQSALQITALATKSGEGTDVLLLISVSITMVSLATKFRSMIFIPRSLTLYAGLAVLTCADAFAFFFWVAIIMPVFAGSSYDEELNTLGNGTEEKWALFMLLHYLGTLGVTFVLIWLGRLWGLLREERDNCCCTIFLGLVMLIPHAIAALFYTVFMAVPALLYNSMSWCFLAVLVSAHTAFNTDQEAALLGSFFKFLRSGCGTVLVLLIFLVQAASTGALPLRMWWDAGHTFGGGATVAPGAVTHGSTYVADFALVAYTVCAAVGLVLTIAGLIVTVVKKRMRAKAAARGSSKTLGTRAGSSRASRVRRLSRQGSAPVSRSASSASSRSKGSGDVVTKNPYAEVEMRPVVRV